MSELSPRRSKSKSKRSSAAKRRGSTPDVSAHASTPVDLDDNSLANSTGITWRELLDERGTSPEHSQSPVVVRRARSPTWSSNSGSAPSVVITAKRESPTSGSPARVSSLRIDAIQPDKQSASPGSHRKDKILAAAKSRMKSAREKSGRIRSKTVLHTPEKKEEREIKKRENAIQKAKAKAAKEAAKVNNSNTTGGPAGLDTAYFQDRTILEQGYLKEKLPGNKWKKRWAILDESNLTLVKDVQDPESTSVRLALIGSACRPVADKSTTFELFGPLGSFLFMADSPKELFTWVNAISQVCLSQTLGAIDPKISERLDKQRPRSTLEQSAESPANVSNTSLDGENPLQAALLELLDIPSNNVCADCSEPEPEWASINLGTFICIQCSGIHRALGTHISKVRSVYLDKWKEEDVQVMTESGNAKVNAVFEFSIPSTHSKPSPDSTSAEKELWIHSKYVERRFTEDAPLIVGKDGIIQLDDLKKVFLVMLEKDAVFRQQVREALEDYL